MKRFLQVLFLLLVSLTAGAQSYGKLWKAVAARQAADQPKSALQELAKVRQKALREGNDAQLLRSVLIERQLQADIAPDSARAVLARMEAAYAAERRPVVRTLWQSALGQVYALQSDTASLSRARSLLLASVSDVPLLGGARAADYLPLFTRGDDARIFSDDLLSVIAQPLLQRAGQTWPSTLITAAEGDTLRRAMLNYYKTQGNRSASLWIELQLVPTPRATDVPLTERTDFQTLMRMKETYSKEALNVETYLRLVNVPGPANTSADSLRIALAREGIKRYAKQPRAAALRNYVEAMEQPTLQLAGWPRVAYPSQPLNAKVSLKNVKNYTLRLYRTTLTAKDLLTNPEAEDAVHDAQLVATQERTLQPHPAYVTFADSFSLACPEPGIYVLRLSSPRMGDTYAFCRSTRLRPLVLTGSMQGSRVTPVDAMSGKPLTGGVVTYYTTTDGKTYHAQTTYTADTAGDIFIPAMRNQPASYLLSVGSDTYLPAFSPYANSYQTQAPYSAARLHTYTDRAIYRPGQEVKFALVAYNQYEDDVQAAAGLDVTVTLHDVNGKALDTLRLTTDELGTTGGTFTLPMQTLPGTFSLRASSNSPRRFQTSWQALRVEEYKRPTFTVDLLEPQVAFKLGDTVSVAGTATTYTGLPLRHAVVKWEVTAGNGFSDADTTLSGETETDEEGRFIVPVKLTTGDAEAENATIEPRGGTRFPIHLRHFNVRADVTATNGETQTASRTLYAARQSSWLTHDWPSVICRENLPHVTLWQRNGSWRNIAAAGSYELRRDSLVVLRDSFQTGQTFVPTRLSELPSGAYTVRISLPGLEPQTFACTLMSETDTRPWGKETLTYYVRTSEAGDSAYVMVGTPRQGVTLFADIIAGGKIVAAERYEISDSIEKFRLAYKPEYGDGARAVFAFVRDGQLFTRDVTVQRPVPDKRLQLRWSTFRNLTRPGAKEEWRLKVVHPDGTPAQASVMACLYDATLDALAKNNWDFSLQFPRRLPWTSYRLATYYGLTAGLAAQLRPKNVPERSFTEWDATLFPEGGFRPYLVGHHRRLLTASRATAQDDGGFDLAESAAPMSANVMMAKSMGAATDETAETTRADVAAAEATERPETTVKPRKNFAETAFFSPALRTDDKGEATLVFDLPESLTTWQFRAWAHNAAFDYGRMDTTVVARKEFMVQANLPRFLRAGDRATLPITLTNLAEKAQSGTLSCDISDAETGKGLAHLTQAFNVADEQVITFTYDATAEHPVLCIRTTAAGTSFADGEERYLPVLSAQEIVTRTVPFSVEEAGTTELRIDTLWQDGTNVTDRRLTVELSSNPTWYAVAALPQVTEKECYSATDWARRYYALTLARFIAEQNPEIRRAARDTASETAWAKLLERNPELKQTLLTETPWVCDAENEAQRVAALAQLFDETGNYALRTTALTKLRDDQLAGGAWGWFKGMQPSVYITTEIAMSLARLHDLAADREADDLLRSAFAYLERETARQVSEMKKAERKYKTSFSTSEQQLKYLYVRALLGKKADADARYLLDKFEKPERTSLWEKAMTAVVLSQYGRTDAAHVAIQSLVEHTVARPGLGRWFDADRALWCGESYRIPTQTAAIEALCRVVPTDTAVIGQMRLWLMQARRTQDWAASRAVCDALYALLVPGAGSSVLRPLSNHVPVYYTLRRGAEVLAVNAQSQAVAPQEAGYFKQVYTDERTLGADNLVVRKKEAGLAWGAVFAQYALPAAAVKQGGNGLLVTRQVEVRRGTSWVPLAAGDAVRHGDRVRQVFTLVADRDYDFVSLKATRAACMEPVEPLSGYVWRDDLSFYRVVRDASNEYFFAQLRKGSHTFTEEAFVDRAGVYTLGTAKVQSLYAPEFGGTSAGATITAQ